MVIWNDRIREEEDLCGSFIRAFAILSKCHSISDAYGEQKELTGVDSADLCENLEEHVSRREVQMGPEGCFSGALGHHGLCWLDHSPARLVACPRFAEPEGRQGGSFHWSRAGIPDPGD